jgi:O-methyltransferase
MSQQLTVTEGLQDYLTSMSRECAILAELREETRGCPQSQMAVAPVTAGCLEAIIKITGARKACEVGVYTGYSSLATAMALPDDGRLWCFDIDPVWTGVARRYWERAGVDHKICLELGDAAASMQRLIDAGHAGTFDLVFIDADKGGYVRYWDLAHRLLRPRGVVVVDNTLFQEVVGPEWTDARLAEKWADLDPRTRTRWIQATHDIRLFNQSAHHDLRFHVVTLPVGDGVTLGVKGEAVIADAAANEWRDEDSDVVDPSAMYVQCERGAY